MEFRDIGFDWLAWFLVGVAVVGVAAFVIHAFVGALVFGLFLYYALRPVYRWLDERSDHGDVNATLTLLTVGLPVVLILVYALLTGVRELDVLLQESGLERFRSVLEPYVDVASVTDPSWLVDLLRGNTGRVVSVVAAASIWLVRLFVALVVAFYLLRDDRSVARWFRDVFEDTPSVVAFAENIDGDLTTIYTGNLLTIGATGLVAVATFYAFDLLAGGNLVSYPLLLGLLVGVATLVPVVGIKLVYVPYTAVLLFRSLALGAVPVWVPVAFFALSVVVVDFVPDMFIRSYLSAGTLHMGLVILSYVLGTRAFGWYGVFLGPVVLAVTVHFLREILPELVDGSADRLALE